MRADELDFEVPPDLIAQVPLEGRSSSRLLCYRRSGRSITHRGFSDLPRILRAGDLLVFNDARVIPAKFLLRKDTGGLVDGLYLGVNADGGWRVLLRNMGPRAVGKHLRFVDAPEIGATVLAQGEGGEYSIAIEPSMSALEVLERVGRMPLPPYIKRERQHDQRDKEDRKRYQTIYARESGSVAAPTAGLHFTEELLRRLDEAEIERTFVTLHVGLGTFRLVTTETLEEHRMHTEGYSIGPAAAEALNRAKREGRRIIAVGTTAARVIESQDEGRAFAAMDGQTGIFIYPPYRWKHVAALITNFHLPRSTLIALVAAMVGLEEQRRIYRVAIEERYRFFSYGDAMFIE